MKDSVSVFPSEKLIVVDSEACYFGNDFYTLKDHSGMLRLEWYQGNGFIEWLEPSKGNALLFSEDKFNSHVQPYVHQWEVKKAELQRKKEEEKSKSLSDEQRWLYLRAKRDALIQETDYLMMEDYPISQESREAFKAYRQALRDLTSLEGAPWSSGSIPFPTKPSVVKK